MADLYIVRFMVKGEASKASFEFESNARLVADHLANNDHISSVVVLDEFGPVEPIYEPGD